MEILFKGIERKYYISFSLNFTSNSKNLSKIPTPEFGTEKDCKVTNRFRNLQIFFKRTLQIFSHSKPRLSEPSVFRFAGANVETFFISANIIQSFFCIFIFRFRVWNIICIKSENRASKKRMNPKRDG